MWSGRVIYRHDHVAQGVGAGEALLHPLAVSLFGDTVPLGSRAKAFAIYFAAGTFGTVGALLLGGALVQWLSSMPGLSLPLVGAVQPWQALFMALAVPGLLLAAVVLVTLKEPARHAPAHSAADASSAMAFLRANPGLASAFFVGVPLLQMAGYTFSGYTFLSWVFIFFDRVHGWGAGKTGVIFALTCGLAFIVGCLFSGRLIGLVRQQGHADASLRACVIGGLGFSGFASGALFMPTPYLSLALLTLAFLFGYLPTVGGYSAVSEVVPPPIRAGLAGFNTLTIELITNSLGPFLVGFFSDHFFPASDGIRWSLLTMTAISVVGGTLAVVADSGRSVSDSAKASRSRAPRNPRPDWLFVMNEDVARKSGNGTMSAGSADARDQQTLPTDIQTPPKALNASAPSTYIYPLLIKHLLHTPLRNAPGQEIVYRDAVRYDYRTLRQRMGRLANGLARLGVKPGDTVGVLDWDSHRYLECYLGIPSMGAVLHMVNIRLTPEQILYTINHADDEFLLVHTDFLPMLESIMDRVAPMKGIVVLADGADVPATTLELAGEYEALLAGAAPDYAFPDFDENTRATTFYTTGTTGLPKGVFFSHRQLVLHALALAAAFGSSATQGRLHRADVYMPITPMFHVHAWGFPYVATMLGIKQVYPGRYAPDILLELLQKEKVTFSHCVPTLLHMLLTSPASTAVDFRGWKLVIGGSALSKGLAKMAVDRGIDIFSGYGMSETGPILTVAHLTPEMLEGNMDQQLEIRTRTGRPVPLVDLRIVDPEANELPYDGRSAGEVVVRAPWLTQGYLKDPRNSEVLWQGGYLHTNDIGYVDPAGYLQITDRLKDVIKTGGEWISSLEIEDIVSQHPGVSEVAVIGVPDAKWGERPLAVVVARSDHADSLTEDAIKAHLRALGDKGVISKWAVPERVVLANAIDKTSVGKIDKKALRERFGRAA